MKKLLLGTITAGKVINDLQESAEMYTDENIPFALWLSNLNEAIGLIHAASADRDKERYRDRVIIPVEKRVSSVQVEDSGYDNTSFVLTLPYDGPVWTNDEDGFDESWEGALGNITKTLPDSTTTFRARASNVATLTTAAAHGLTAGDVVVIAGVGGTGYNGTFTVVSAPTTTSITYASVEADEGSTADIGGTVTFPSVEYPIKITEVIDGQNVVIESTNDATIPAIIDDNLLVDIKTSVSKAADEIDLTLYDNYKRIDYIEKMTFTKSTTSGGKTTTTEHMAVGPDKVTIKNFDGMRYSQNYKKLVIWYLQGEILKCSKGDLTSYGTRQLYVVLKPKPVTEPEDLLDVVDELLPQIKKVVMVMTIPADKMKLAFPQEWLNYYNQLQASKQAVKEEKEKNK